MRRHVHMLFCCVDAFNQAGRCVQHASELTGHAAPGLAVKTLPGLCACSALCRLEYVNVQEAGSLSLEWRGPGTGGRQRIPQGNLSPVQI